MAKDPVCGMQVDEKKAAGQSSYQGKLFYFCSAACKAKFDQSPAPASFISNVPVASTARNHHH